MWRVGWGCLQLCGVPSGAGSDPANVNAFGPKKKLKFLLKFLLPVWKKFR